MERRLPFQGVKVLEWTQAINGPWTGAYFADFGAEVIKIESTKFPEMGRVSSPYKDNIPGFNRSITFNTFNTSKESFTVNLRDSRGYEIFMKLVAWADIVLQNQRPGLMKNMALGYEELIKVKEDIILLEVGIMGQEGPLVGVGGWGSNSMAQSGQFYYYRFPDSGPASPGFTAVPDVIGPMFAAMAGIAALDYKRRTGKGQHLDISQLEPLVHFLGPAVLDFTVNGRIQPPVGSRDPYAAPHNAFRCRGDDRWCVIAVFTDEEWQGFCRVLGNPEWTKSPKFATLSARKDKIGAMKKDYEKELAKLPKGSLIKKNVKGYEYYYLVVREKGKVKFTYKGKEVSDKEIQKYKQAKEYRAKYRKLLSEVKKQIKFLRSTLRGKKSV